MINRNAISGYFNVNPDDDRLIRDLQIMITRAKKYNLVSSTSQKDLHINDKAVGKLLPIVNFLKWISDNETKNLRTSFETMRLIDFLIEAIDSRKELVVLALLCPSYKKGIGEFGFNKEIGESTRIGVDNTGRVYGTLRDMGFNVRMVIIFADLVIENYKEITSHNALGDLQSNISSARSYLAEKSDLAEFHKLSSFNYIASRLPLCGIDDNWNSIDFSTYQLVLKRNMNFYINQFGWTTDKVVARTKTLASSYPIIGDFFRNEFGNILFVYTANSYERAAMYQGLDAKTNPIPIFFPKKLVKPS